MAKQEDKQPGQSLLPKGYSCRLKKRAVRPTSSAGKVSPVSEHADERHCALRAGKGSGNTRASGLRRHEGDVRTVGDT